VLGCFVFLAGKELKPNVNDRMKTNIVSMPTSAATSNNTAAPDQTCDGFLSTQELLERIPISAGTLANWRKSGSIPFVKLGRRVIFHFPSVVEALLRMQRGGDR
jgi:hypothetical protein